MSGSCPTRCSPALRAVNAALNRYTHFSGIRFASESRPRHSVGVGECPSYTVPYAACCLITEVTATTQVIPIVHIPGFGDKAAEKVCTDLKIASQNDAKKLAEAKNMVYLKGFTEGVMLVGPHAGKKARSLISACCGLAVKFLLYHPKTQSVNIICV